jgi:hypothetical protein
MDDGPKASNGRLLWEKYDEGKIGTLTIFRLLASPLTEEQRAKNG